jgi:NADH:ubiquinone oxidoreductase subunit 6 (subunit J)
MTIFWICGALMLLASLVATFAGDVRVSILALGLAGLAAGGLHLSLGAELLAVIQWIVSTLITLALLTYSVTYGEFGVQDARKKSQRAIDALFPVLLGGTLTGVIWLGTRHLPIAGVVEVGPPEGIAKVGRALLDGHILSLELLAVLLLLVIVGSGVLSRPDRGES